MVICLERGADLHMAQLMPLPLTVSCFSKIQIGFTFLVPAHLGSPRQRAVKRVCVCVCVPSRSMPSESQTLTAHCSSDKLNPARAPHSLRPVLCLRAFEGTHPPAWAGKWGLSRTCQPSAFCPLQLLRLAVICSVDSTLNNGPQM